jgi:2-oxo-4-hydroxy-4-carboxy--5-ureidoimidazoline (OHCU) decarboxylase
MAYLYGMMSGTMRALRVSKDSERTGTVWQSVKTGESGYGVGKIEQPLISGFSPEKLGIGKDSMMYYPARVADATVSLPGKALMAADEFFKTINYDGEIQALAYREASKKVKSGEITEDQFYNEINRLTRDPEQYMSMHARVKAERNTFTDTPERTAVYRGWEGVGNIPIFGKLVLPFKKTPYNIGLYSFERTPLAFAVKRFRDDMAAGGVKQDMATAQLVMGNTLLMMGADAALNGSITGGGPSDFKEREAWLQEHAPYSFEFTDENGEKRSYSYLGVEPIGTFLSLSSSIVDILKTQDWDDENKSHKDLALAATISIAATATSQQYMSGLSDFFEMMNDPQRNAERYFNRLSGMVAPTGVAQFTYASDPNMRYVGGMIDAIKSRTPGLSKELPATYDRWGQERTRESGLGPIYDGVSPFYSRSIKPEPIDLELRRLNKFVGKPNGRQSFESQNGGIEINLKEHFPHAYWRLVELRGNEVTETALGSPIQASGYVSSGKPLREELNLIAEGQHPFVADEVYQMLTDGEDGGKQALLMNVINAHNKAAKEQLLKEFPDLKVEVESRTNTPKYKFME